jgi:membrane protein DedA with SNARE-associated domain
MSGITDVITSSLSGFAESVPLPIFMFLGAIAEEIIAVIPSPFVPLTAGSIAVAQEKSLLYLLLLAIIGTFAKTMASTFTYWIADKLEDILTQGKLGKFLGLESEDLERYGKMINKGSKDELAVIALRALPFVPTLPVSVVAGLIKMNLRSFIWSTFVGIFIRNAFYLLVAYYGAKQFENLLASFDTVNLILEVLVVAIFAGVAFLLLRKNWDRWLEMAKKAFQKKK